MPAGKARSSLQTLEAHDGDPAVSKPSAHVQAAVHSAAGITTLNGRPAALDRVEGAAAPSRLPGSVPAGRSLAGRHGQGLGDQPMPQKGPSVALKRKPASTPSTEHCEHTSLDMILWYAESLEISSSHRLPLTQARLPCYRWRQCSTKSATWLPNKIWFNTSTQYHHPDPGPYAAAAIAWCFWITGTSLIPHTARAQEALNKG